MTKALIPVVIAGGSGTRLWPMSRASYPKQFLSLTHHHSLLQETILRLKSIEHLPVSIVCNQEHRFLAAEHMRELDIAHAKIILEPCARNTAPAIALAALNSLKTDKDAILLVLPADHLIENAKAFCQSIEQAMPLAAKGKLVTFGITPTKAETGYGYIQAGKKIAPCSFAVQAFIEKPSLKLAQYYLNQDAYYWNSGIFMFRASTYLHELKKFRPEMLRQVSRAFALSREDTNFLHIDEKSFAACQEDSIDFAVMEKTTQAVILPMDVAWSDVGSWASLWEINKKDENQNVICGEAILKNSQGCYINAPKRLIAAIGVNDLIIVDTKDALLIANREDVQGIKEIVGEIKQSEHEKKAEETKI